MRTQREFALPVLFSIVCLTSIVWVSGCSRAAEGGSTPAPGTRGTPGTPGTPAPRTPGSAPESPSEASADAAASGAELIRLEPAELDLGGGHEAGKTVQGTVRLTNTSDRPVSITKTRTSCGCTTAQVPEEPIEPGDSADVTVRLRITGKPGTIRRKSVWFYADGHDKPFALTVFGRVADTIMIDLDDLARPIDEDATIVLRSTDKSSFSVIRADPPVVRTVPTSRPRATHELTISSSLWRQHGSPKRITFALDHPEFSTVDLEIPSASKARARARSVATPRSGSLSQPHESLSIHPRRLNVGLLDPAPEPPAGDDPPGSHGQAQSGVIREIVVHGIARSVDSDLSCSPGISCDSPFVEVQVIDWRTIDDGVAIRIAVRQREQSAESTRQRTRVNVTCGQRQGYFYLYFTPAPGSSGTTTGITGPDGSGNNRAADPTTREPAVGVGSTSTPSATAPGAPGFPGVPGAHAQPHQRTDSSPRTPGQGT